MKKIAIFASGSGTNAENIVRIFHEGNRIRVALVIANREKAGVHKRMADLGVPSMTIPNAVWDNNPEQIVDVLNQHEIDLVVLAGFMHKVDSAIITAYKDRIINIHPSLLPAYGGVGMYGLATLATLASVAVLTLIRVFERKILPSSVKKTRRFKQC